MTDEVWEEGEAILTTAKKCGFLAYFCFMGFMPFLPIPFNPTQMILYQNITWKSKVKTMFSIHLPRYICA